MATDPRLAPIARERSVVPVVERPRGGVSGLAIGIAALVLGVVLFAVLDGRRRSLSAPAVTERGIDPGATSAAPPPLFVPPAPVPAPVVIAAPAPVAVPTPAPAPTPYRIPRTYEESAPPPRRSAAIDDDQPARPVRTPSVAGKPALVVDTSQARPATSQAEASSLIAAGSLSAVLSGTDRARSGTLANPATTVPQGSTIPAVLESAIDTTRPSLVRALVRRDVRGFDGTRVLIPRGSRLVGEVRIDNLPGQNRANVIWTRLIRPDGITIALGSPAADPLGRAGIKGKVDSHFWERFGGALLQSSLELGATVAARSGGGGSVVLLPNAVSSSSGVSGGLFRSSGTAPPTIKVAAGTSVSVSVARDLDFSATGG